MIAETYTLDVATILTLMGIGFMLGFMMGKRFLQIKMMIIFIIVFLIGTLFFLDSTQVNQVIP